MAHREQFDILIADGDTIPHGNLPINTPHNLYTVKSEPSSPVQLSDTMVVHFSNDNFIMQKAGWYATITVRL